jgi:hypothetical protein
VRGCGLGLRFAAGSLNGFRVELDHATFELDPAVVADGFEFGDTTAWSATP